MHPIPSQIRALLFDCDGTLVDTMPMHLQAWQETLRTFDITVSQDFLASYRGATVTDIVAAVSLATGKTIDESIFVPRKQARFRELLPGVREIGVVADLVRAHHGQRRHPSTLPSTPHHNTLPPARWARGASCA